jgi:hypothetical protein
MVDLRHALLDGVFDAREFDADIIDGEAGDLGNLTVAEASRRSVITSRS